jgi:ParB family chromosome partitioning protein
MAATKTAQEREEAKRASAAQMAAEMAALNDEDVATEQVARIEQVTLHREELQSGGAQRLSIALIDPSPYQPVGRPSSAAVAAVAHAMTETGSLEALVHGGERDSPLYARLSDEAKALASLGADIARHGVEQPLEVRTKGERFELLSGHRRLAAARLAGNAEVSAVVRPVESEVEAALIVFRRNQNRADFSHWQQARRLAALYSLRTDERAAAGLPVETQAEFAAVAGVSVGLLNQLLAIARGFDDATLRDLGDGDTTVAEEALSQHPKAWLLKTATIKDPGERVLAARLKIRRPSGPGGAQSQQIAPDEGLGTSGPSGPAHSLSERSKGRGPVLELQCPVTQMSREQAEALKADLARLRKQVDARLKTLSGDSA